MFVTTIVRLDKKKSLIVLDEDIKISLYQSELYKYGIQENVELPDDICKDIFEKLLPRRARERVFYMLKDSDKSEHDIRTKLLSAYYPEPIVEDIICYMKSMNYLDDKRFVDNYIRSHRKQKSINRIKSDLHFHGVDKRIISESIELLKEDCDFLEEEQQNIIRKEFIKRRYDFQNKDEKLKNKIIMSLVRKGFEFDDIYSVYRDMKENID